MSLGGSRKSPGWAAFDRKLQPPNDDSFPPLSSGVTDSSPTMAATRRSIVNGGRSSSTIPRNSAKNQSSTLLQLQCITHATEPETEPEPKPEPEPEYNSPLMGEGIGRFNWVPIEPEWEDDGGDDIYLAHRKEALRTMRLASRHSKAASNAFLRGDHSSAQKHSVEARHKYSDAQTLHAKAAAEILRARNAQSSIWNLDLHGLHVAEALHYLQQYLDLIENQFLSKPDTHVKPSSSSLLQNAPLIRKRPTSVQVITGVGNHSGGQASLPTAVRGFLNENGYHFEEFKPGVITIRPKFRIST